MWSDSQLQANLAHRKDQKQGEAAGRGCRFANPVQMKPRPLLYDVPMETALPRVGPSLQ